MGWRWAVIGGLLGQAALVQAGEPDQQQPRIEVQAPDWVSLSEPLPVPDGAQGALFVRRSDLITRLTAKGEAAYLSQLVRILQPGALELGNVAFAWNPAAGEAVVHTLRIHRGTEIIDVLGKASFEVLRREDRLEAAMLDGTLTAVLKVPDLRVGDDLEIAYTIPINDPTLRENSSGLMLLQPSIPPGRYRLELSWDEGQRPRTKATADIAPFLEEQPDRLVARFDNPPTITPPRDAPPRYAWQRVIEYSDFADWQAISRRFHGLFMAAAKLPPGAPLRKEAGAIAAAHPGKLAQAQAALELVQQQVRYVYVGFGGGNYLPASAEETWNRRYGDCKGKTALLLALLGELGIEAEPVLVNNSQPTDGLETRLPSPNLFDHVLVRARIGREVLWLDATLPAVIDGRNEPFLAYQWILPLAAKGATIERLPQKPFALPQDMEIHELDASAGFDSPAKRTVTYLKRGIAGLVAHNTFSAVSAEQLEASLRSELAGSEAWDNVERVTYRFDETTRTSILTIAGTGPIEWEQENGYTYTRLPAGGFNPPPRRQRPAGESRDAPFYTEPSYTCYVTTMRLPADTRLEEWSVNSWIETILFGRIFYRQMQLASDHTLRLVRGSRVEEPEIPVSTAERDNGRLARFDNSMALLTWTKDARQDHSHAQQPVPATFAFDWTSAAAPCLPETLRTAP